MMLLHEYFFNNCFE